MPREVSIVGECERKAISRRHDFGERDPGAVILPKTGRIKLSVTAFECRATNSSESLLIQHITQGGKTLQRFAQF